MPPPVASFSGARAIPMDTVVQSFPMQNVPCASQSCNAMQMQVLHCSSTLTFYDLCKISSNTMCNSCENRSRHGMQNVPGASKCIRMQMHSLNCNLIASRYDLYNISPNSLCSQSENRSRHGMHNVPFASQGIVMLMQSLNCKLSLNFL